MTMSVSGTRIRHMPARRKGGAADRRQVSATPRGAAHTAGRRFGRLTYTPFVPARLVPPPTPIRVPGSPAPAGGPRSRDVAAARGGRAEGSDSDSEYVTAQRFVCKFRTAHAPPPQPAHGRIAGRLRLRSGLRVWPLRSIARGCRPVPTSVLAAICAYKSCTS